MNSIKNQIDYKNSKIILPLILFVGILLIAYGFFNEYNIALYLGLLVTIGGVIEGIIKIIFNSE